MKAKDFIEKVKSDPSYKYDLNIEAYITKEIIAGNINFLTLMASYFKYVERQKEIDKCEKIEMATLLTLNELGIKIPQQKEREIHMMVQYSNMNIDDLKEKYHYDNDKMSEDFKKRFYDYPH